MAAKFLRVFLLAVTLILLLHAVLRATPSLVTVAVVALAASAVSVAMNRSEETEFTVLDWEKARQVMTTALASRYRLADQSVHRLWFRPTMPWGILLDPIDIHVDASGAARISGPVQLVNYLLTTLREAGAIA